MKIAYVYSLFPAPRETFAARELISVAQQGVEVRTYSFRPRAKDTDKLSETFKLSAVFRNYAAPGDIPLIILACARRPGIILSCLRLLAACRSAREVTKTFLCLPRAIAIAERISSWQADITHIFWGHYPSMVLWFLKRNYRGIKASLFLGSYDLTDFYAGSKLAAAVSDVIFTHSLSNIPAIHQQIGRQIPVSVVYRGIDINAAHVSGTSTPVREPLQFLAVGALVEGKRFDQVIEAFATVLATHPDARLMVIGDGPQRDDLEGLAARKCGDRVAFTGHQPPSNVFAAMARSTVFLFMSTAPWERIPNVVKEAMLLGNVCIVGASEGINELIDSGNNGFVVNSASEAASVALDVIARPDDMKQVIGRAQETIRRRFDVQTNVRGYIQAWESALRTPS